MADFSYVRVSTLEQNTSRQTDAMAALGIPPERIFIDRLSGKDMARPQLHNLLATIYSIVRAEQQRAQPHRAHDIDR